MRSLPHRALGGLVAALTVVGAAMASSPPAQAAGSSGAAKQTRLAGTDLYATAASIAVGTFGTSTDAIVATSASPYDAAAGEYLAGVLKAPVLFTPPGSLAAPTAGALATLHARSVIVLGGPLAVGDGVVGQLEGDGYGVTRIGGTDVYGTAQAVAEHAGPAGVGTSGGASPTAIVTSARGGDLQAAGPLAYAGPFPVLYSSPAGLPQSTVDALRALGIRHVLILGGTLAVPAGVTSTLSTLGITAERLAGADNLSTAVEVADYEIAELGFTAGHVDVARGNDYADALAGASHAGAGPSPLLLTASASSVGSPTLGWLTDNCAALTSMTIFGGPLAVSDAAASEMSTAMTCQVTGIPTSLVLSPTPTTGVVGSPVTVTATALLDGKPVTGAHVDFFVVDKTVEGQKPGTGCAPTNAATRSSTGTAPCAIDATDPTTNSKGQATFTYQWKSPQGRRPVEGSWPQAVYAFSGDLGATYGPTQVTAQADVTWINGVSSIQLSPAPTVHYGNTAVVSATLMSTSNEGTTAPVPDPGQTIAYRVYRGTACPSMTAPPPGTPVVAGTALTDASGTATIRYLYAPQPVPSTQTTDCVFAFYDRNTSGSQDAGEPATAATVTWSSAPSAASALTLSPANASALAASGATQTLAAEVVDQYGAPVAGEPVSWEITRAGQTVAAGSGTTGADGQVAIEDPSPDASAMDTVTATAGSLPVASTTAYWVTPAGTGSCSGTVIGYQSLTASTGVIDVSCDSQYLRFGYDTNDVLKIGTSTVHLERFTESLTAGSTIAITYASTKAGVSTFALSGSSHGGGGGGGGGGHGGGGYGG